MPIKPGKKVKWKCYACDLDSEGCKVMVKDKEGHTVMYCNSCWIYVPQCYFCCELIHYGENAFDKSGSDIEFIDRFKNIDYECCECHLYTNKD